MGFFSWKCKGCEEEICEPEIAAVVDEDGIVARGEYDGYGRVGGYEVQDYEPAIWHHQCFNEASVGEQTNLTKSKHAPDQGMGAANPRFCKRRT